MRISDWSSDVCSSDLLAAWQEKAVREAKRHSGWTEPNLAYEAACRSFLERLLSTHDVFVSELAGFVASIAAAGAVNALSQTVLRLTTPGVPETYQGCEFWASSWVDPAHRRPGDFIAPHSAPPATQAEHKLF